MIPWALFATAWAGLGVRTSREPLPSREIERSVVLPKGWTQLELGIARSVATQAWDETGGAVPLEVPWRSTSVAIGVRYGLAPGWEMFGELPWRASTGWVAQQGFGTAEIGTRFALERSEAPFHSIALEFAGRAPIGFDGGSLEVPGPVPITTGTGDLRVAVGGRRAVEGVLFRGRLEATRRFAGRVGWSEGWVKPGDQGAAEVEVAVQAGPLLLGPSVRGVARGPVRTGDSRGSLFPVRTSAGANVDLSLRLLLQLTRGLELEGRLSRAVLGQDDQFVFLDELNPAKSRVTGLKLRVGW